MTNELGPELRSQIENTIRFLAVDAVEKAGCGHPGAPMGLARTALELWDRHLHFDPTDPAWPLRDRFVLSAGHASMLLYSLLHLYGYDVSMDDLVRFRQGDSKTPGHPEHGETPGVEVTTGPLGQGFGHAVGIALAARMTRARFAAGDAGPGRHFVYVIASDGDLMEGISYESASLAGHLGLGNLVVLYDDNQITIDGPTRFSFSEDVGKRFEAHGWHVQRVDGEDHEGALARARRGPRGDGAPVADRGAHRDRARQPEPRRQQQGARRDARRRGGEEDEGGARLAARADLPRPAAGAGVPGVAHLREAGRAEGRRRRARALARGEPGARRGVGGDAEPARPRRSRGASSRRRCRRRPTRRGSTRAP